MVRDWWVKSASSIAKQMVVDLKHIRETKGAGTLSLLELLKIVMFLTFHYTIKDLYRVYKTTRPLEIKLLERLTRLTLAADR